MSNPIPRPAADLAECHPDLLAAATELVAALSLLMPRAAQRNGEIFMQRHGLADGRVWTLKEIGAHHGVTRERVRQVLVTMARQARQHYPGQLARLRAAVGRIDRHQYAEMAREILFFTGTHQGVERAHLSHTVIHHGGASANVTLLSADGCHFDQVSKFVQKAIKRDSVVRLSQVLRSLGSPVLERDRLQALLDLIPWLVRLQPLDAVTTKGASRRTHDETWLTLRDLSVVSNHINARINKVMSVKPRALVEVPLLHAATQRADRVARKRIPEEVFRAFVCTQGFLQYVPGIDAVQLRDPERGPFTAPSPSEQAVLAVLAAAEAAGQPILSRAEILMRCPGLSVQMVTLVLARSPLVCKVSRSSYRRAFGRPGSQENVATLVDSGCLRRERDGLRKSDSPRYGRANSNSGAPVPVKATLKVTS